MAFDGSSNIAHYGTCSTAAATAAKAVSITGFSLVTGAHVTVLFSNGNTAASPTLNVSDTGAKPIYYRGVAVPVDYIQSGAVLALVYSGSYWRVEGDLTQYQVDALRAQINEAAPQLVIRDFIANIPGGTIEIDETKTYEFRDLPDVQGCVPVAAITEDYIIPESIGAVLQLLSCRIECDETYILRVTVRNIGDGLGGGDGFALKILYSEV